MGNLYLAQYICCRFCTLGKVRNFVYTAHVKLKKCLRRLYGVKNEIICSNIYYINIVIVLLRSK